jgi:hypothetical protein
LSANWRCGVATGLILGEDIPGFPFYGAQAEGRGEILMSESSKEKGEATFFVLEEVHDSRFPYRLTIRKGDKVLLGLRVQDRWPGQRGNVFCIREERGSWISPHKELERVPILLMKRLGKRLSLVLDRAQRKRCDFLFLTKKYRTKEGEYEQIFWRTQKALTSHRTRAKLSTSGACSINILVDTSERYPWKFQGCQVTRQKLPVGDYALAGEKGELLAIVERKTMENMLTDFAKMPAFHQQLSELSSYRHCALVIEANYADFLNPAKVPYCRPSFVSMAIAEISALHPGLLVVFAGNRKLAQEWTLRFFRAVQAHSLDKPHPKVAEVLEHYGKSMDEDPNGAPSAKGTED